MALKNITQDIGSTFKSMSDSIMGKDFKYGKHLAITLLIIALGAASFYSYRWYMLNKEYTAYQLFAQNVEEFERVAQDSKQKEDWANVEMLFKLGYDQYQHTSVAPYYLIYQAQAMVKQNKPKEEIKALMDKAITAMPKKAAVTSLYKIKIALLQLDMLEGDYVAQGLKALQDIAADVKNEAFDVAAYYLGLYYWTHEQTQQAREIWQKLIDSQKDVEQLGQSPWAKLAKAKLGTIA